MRAEDTPPAPRAQPLSRPKSRRYTGRAALNSTLMQLTTQVAIVKAAGCMQKSTEVPGPASLRVGARVRKRHDPPRAPQVMSAMNQAIKLPEIQATMMNMSREMQRAGLIEEVMCETMESLDEDGVEEESDAEVSKVVAELTGSLFGESGAEAAATVAPTALPQKPAAEPAAAEEEAAAAEPPDEALESEMMARLQAL